MKTKFCSYSKCLQREKLLSEFSKQSARKDGLHPWCKECVNEYDKENHGKYPWKKIFHDINTRCNNQKFKQYKNYGGRDIKNHLKLEDVEFLWFRDKAYNMKKPSIDRENSNKHYILSNCRFIEFVENAGKDKRKIILQYDLNNKFIKEFVSILEAGIEFETDPSSISKCARGKLKTSGGFKWRYKELT